MANLEEFEDYKMNETQSKILEILIEIDRICRKHNIKYFLCGGTLLGAVRHKGFIPWDDDIDIDMLREDYEKFKEVCKTDLNPKYFYQDAETDPYYGNIFAKIRNNDINCLEEACINNAARRGFYVDIFPLDDYKKDSRTDFRIVCYWRMLLLAKCNYYLSPGLKTAILKIARHFVSRRFIINRINRIIKKNRVKDSKNLMSYGDYAFETTLLPREWYSKQKEYIFEGHKFTGTKYYDEYLEYQYGDYMTPLPPDERKDHGFIKIDEE